MNEKTESGEGQSSFTDQAYSTEDQELKIEAQQTLDWARQPQVWQDELLRTSTDPRQDIEAQVHEVAISSITSDDWNIFAGLSLLPFNADRSHIAQESMKIRTDWELSVTSLPESIKTILADYRKQLDSSEWRNEAEFRAAMSQWQERKNEIRSLLS